MKNKIYEKFENIKTNSNVKVRIFGAENSTENLAWEIDSGSNEIIFEIGNLKKLFLDLKKLSPSDHIGNKINPLKYQTPIPKELLDLLDPNKFKNRQVEDALFKALEDPSFSPEKFIKYTNKIPFTIYIPKSIILEIKSRGWKINRTIFTAIKKYC